MTVAMFVSIYGILNSSYQTISGNGRGSSGQSQLMEHEPDGVCNTDQCFLFFALLLGPMPSFGTDNQFVMGSNHVLFLVLDESGKRDRIQRDRVK